MVLMSSVPPSIYKKVKQVPDDERETFLVKELEGILSREGLSKNPSEKGNGQFICQPVWMFYSAKCRDQYVKNVT